MMFKTAEINSNMKCQTNYDVKRRKPTDAMKYQKHYDERIPFDIKE